MNAVQPASTLALIDCGNSGYFIEQYRNADPATREVIDMLLGVGNAPRPWVDCDANIYVWKMEEKVRTWNERRKRAGRAKLTVIRAGCGHAQ